MAGRPTKPLRAHVTEGTFRARRISHRALLIGSPLPWPAFASLQARYQQPVVVFTAATVALWAVSLIAVVLGNRLGAWIPERPLQLTAAGVMVLVAIALISGLLG